MKFTILSFLACIALTLGENDYSRTLQDGNEQFTARMFTEVVKKNPTTSVVMSAYSVLPPLAQLALASVGESHDELLASIGMPNDNVTKAVFSQYDSNLKSVEGVVLTSASKIYVAQNYELNDDFAKVSRDVFHSDAKNVDFTASDKTAHEINTWVEDQTNQKIKNLVDPNSLSSLTRAVLVNAIYFKGMWKNPFSNYSTYEEDFHVTKDKTVKVPMMHQTEHFQYAEVQDLDAKILELPYNGDKASMLIVLPNEVDGISALERKLQNPKALQRAISQMQSYEVAVSLPKFKIETTTNLKDVLQEMNVKKLFSPREARLDNLIKGEGSLYISDALQKAFIEVNEEGAEAAAANVFMGFGAIPGLYSDPKIFHAKSPFYFEIRVNSTALFSGVKLN